MSELTLTNKNLPTVTGTWAAARGWLEYAKKFEQCKLWAQVMLGFELMELRRKLPNESGKRSDLTSSQDGTRWDKALEDELNIARTTAYRFMDMAKSAAKALRSSPELKDLDLINTPLSELPAPRQAALANAVKKITDGKTQLEFMWEIGTAKRPSGNPNAKGGKRGKLTTEESAIKLREMALEDSGLMGAAINASNRNFFLLTDVNDVEVNAQIAVLEFALKLRRKWVDTPKARRDSNTVEGLLKESPLK